MSNGDCIGDPSAGEWTNLAGTIFEADILLCPVVGMES